MDANFYQQLIQDKDTTPAFGYEVLRDVLLPELTESNPTILYWAGKRLAREIFLAGAEDLPLFFEKAGWGTLKLVSTKRDQQLFELSGAVVKLRQQNVPQVDFLLEAGFLAETLQNQIGFTTEAIIKSTDQRNGIISFLVQRDSKDPLDPAILPEKEPLKLTTAVEK
ncbi:YslB family protein [Liquorilactobacillus satsumensis]|uniref:YslB family protein n=1 Tax=Liquorilactobacillus satsumensis TaxID=259059 RepID=UPI0021C3F7A6|nr:YslB family protein [Liquorilactobacillus satsumensis]MCP9327592.1 YslB family protein [Liquorilactobacillus satsumensis]